MNNTEMTLTVVPGKSDYAVDEEIIVEISMSNGGGESCWLNGRMLVNTKHAPAAYREITLLVTQNGVELPFLAKIKVGEVTPSEYVLLGADETLTRQYCLSELFSVQTPAEYLITALYEDGNDSPPDPPPGAMYVAGPIRSQPCQFSVREA